MVQTLDQKRAAHAWERARKNAELGKEYVNLAKGAPALIMGNGLMSSLAFYESRKANRAAKALLQDILDWLARRNGGGNSATLVYTAAMRVLFESGSTDYMQATDETLAMLKWLRQFADAATPSRGE